MRSADDTGMPKKLFEGKSKFDLVASDAKSSSGARAQFGHKSKFGESENGTNTSHKKSQFGKTTAESKVAESRSEAGIA